MQRSTCILISAVELWNKVLGPNRICVDAVLMHLRCVAAHGLPRRNANVVLQSWSRLEHHIRDVFSCSVGCFRCVNDKKVNWQRTWPPHFADTAGIGCYSYCATSCGASSTWIVSNEVKWLPLYCILVVDEVCCGMLLINGLYGLVYLEARPARHFGMRWDCHIDGRSAGPVSDATWRYRVGPVAGAGDERR